MALQAEYALLSDDTNTNRWSARYAVTLREQLAQAAPDLEMSTECDRIGLTIAGTGWAIHSVRSDPDGERYLSLMAMAASERQLQAAPVLGE
jgi:hypothetical protein